MILALSDDRVRHFQCNYCPSFLVFDCTNCQKTRDCKGHFNDCILEEVAWYKGSFSLGKHARPCCSTCMLDWPTAKTRQANKVESFMKYGHQICAGCTVVMETPHAPPAVALQTISQASQPPPAPQINLATIAQHQTVMGGFITSLQIELADLRDLKGLDDTVLALTDKVNTGFEDMVSRAQALGQQATLDRVRAAEHTLEVLARCTLKSQSLEELVQRIEERMTLRMQRLEELVERQSAGYFVPPTPQLGDIEEVGTLPPVAEEEEPWQWPASTEAHFIGEERITPGNGGDACGTW